MRFQTALVGALCALGMLVAGTSTASAASPDVVISQVYGGGGNASATYQNDFVELFNRGSASVSLTGWSVEYTSATGTGLFSANAQALTGSIPAGRYYLVKLASQAAVGAVLPTADATGSINMSGTAGKVIVANTATVACNGSSTACSSAQLANIVDLVGYGGANFFEGAMAAPLLSNTTAALRAGSGCTDTDNNGADFTAPAPAPRNSTTAIHTCGSPTPTNPSGTGAASPASVAPGAGTLLTVVASPGANPASTGLAVNADLSSIGGSASQQLFDDGTHGDVTAADSTFSFQATVSPATSAGAKSLPFTITDAQSRSGSGSIALTVSGSCGSSHTPIHDVQGSGSTSPVVGSTVSIEGVVVGDYQATGAFDGYYLQEPDATADANPATSEGIFVYNPGGTAVSAGDVVRVTGTVSEFTSGTSSLTEISSVSAVTVCSSGAGATVTPTDLALPVSSMSDFERYEGMLVHFTQPLTVSDTFTLGRFGELRLAQGGRLYVPTAITDPGAPAAAQEDLNNRRSVVLDDGDNQQDIDPVRYPLGGLSATNTLRSGDTISALTAVFDDRFSTYRAQPVGPVSFTATNPRSATPPDVGGNLKVASFNVLNFFNGNGSHQEGSAGGFPTERGANTLTEFNRQKDKEISALSALNADVFGLMELENDAPPNSAIEDLVAGLNAKLGTGTYSFIDTGVIGTDAIKVGLIYKPGKVTPVGPFKILTTAVDPRFIDTKNRPSLAQTFELNATHRRITIDVNHLKSKGSDCNDVGDPDTGDGQGNCDLTRKKAAQALVDWLATDPTGGGTADKLLIGDMNSYTFEDPIKVFTGAGFTNLVREHGSLASYSYVFDGESGYLDHALATPSLAPKVTGAEDWHINSDEPIVLDYNTEFKSAGQISSFYDPGPFRASDHDPVLIGISLPAKATPSLSTSASPSAASLGASISDAATLSGGNSPSGSTTFNLYGPDDPSCAAAPLSTTTVAVSSGNATYTSASYTPVAAGTYRWVASYSGDADNDAIAGSCGDSNESVIVVASGTLPTAPICVGTSASYSGTVSGHPEQQVTVASSTPIHTIDNVVISNGTVHTGGGAGPLVPLAPSSLTLPADTHSVVLTAVKAGEGLTHWSFRATDQDSNPSLCV